MMDFTMSNIAQLSVRLRRDAASMEHGQAQEDVRAAAKQLERVAEASLVANMLKRTLAVSISDVSTKTRLYELASQIADLLSIPISEHPHQNKETTS